MDLCVSKNKTSNCMVFIFKVPIHITYVLKFDYQHDHYKVLALSYHNRQPTSSPSPNSTLATV